MSASDLTAPAFMGPATSAWAQAVAKHPAIPLSYMMVAESGTHYALPCKNGLEKYSGTDGGAVIQDVIDAITTGNIGIKGTILADTTITPKNGIMFTGENQASSIIKANTAMDTMFDLTDLVQGDIVRFEHLYLDGDSKATKLIDATHAENTWVQVRLRHCTLKRAITALADLTYIDGSGISDCLLMGSNDGGTELITDYGLYINGHGGHCIVDSRTIFTSFKTTPLFYHTLTNQGMLSLHGVNFSQALRPAGAYVDLQGTACRVAMHSVWMEDTQSTINAPFIQGDTTNEPILMNLYNPRLFITSQTKPHIGGKFNMLNVFGGTFNNSAATPYEYSIDATINTFFGVFRSNATSPINTAVVTRYTFQEGSQNRLFRTNLRNSNTSTGTGAQQTIAHSLPATPTRISLSNITSGANPYQSAAADSTNIYITAVNTKQYMWEAWVA